MNIFKMSEVVFALTFKDFQNSESDFPFTFTKHTNRDFKWDFPYRGTATYYVAFNKNKLIAVAAIAENHIFLFEVNKSLRHKGYGTKFFKKLLKDEQFSHLTLYYLDLNAKSFWQKMGFVSEKDLLMTWSKQ